MRVLVDANVCPPRRQGTGSAFSIRLYLGIYLDGFIKARSNIIPSDGGLPHHSRFVASQEGFETNFLGSLTQIAPNGDGNFPYS